MDIAEKADLIVDASIIGFKGNAMQLSRYEVLKGSEFRPDIQVWLKHKNECRPSKDTFISQKDWVFALKKISSVPDDGFNPNTPNSSFGLEGDYEISSCGAYWLKSDDNIATGNLLSGKRFQFIGDEIVSVTMLANYFSGRINRTDIDKAVAARKEAEELMKKTKLFLINEGR